MEGDNQIARKTWKRGWGRCCQNELQINVHPENHWAADENGLVHHSFQEGRFIPLTTLFTYYCGQQVGLQTGQDPRG